MLLLANAIRNGLSCSPTLCFICALAVYFYATTVLYKNLYENLLHENVLPKLLNDDVVYKRNSMKFNCDTSLVSLTCRLKIYSIQIVLGSL